MRCCRRTRLLSVGMMALLLASSLLALPGCGRRVAPPPPEVLPRTMPSEEEGRQAGVGAPEAVPILPEGERGVGRESLYPGEGVPPGSEATPAEIEGHRRYGYRVQLFATADRELATAQAGEYRQFFSAAVYVEFEGLLYKVQVGDCLSRDEAEVLRREALGLGCDGAFVIDALVHAR
ncbi:MAG: SPOR domain-containing protein [Candidatus Eisenbacteria sp.]|nr:SPOR domain-containing protein [Candidatus Eisenbacteria bacterium]